MTYIRGSRRILFFFASILLLAACAIQPDPASIAETFETPGTPVADRLVPTYTPTPTTPTATPASEPSTATPEPSPTTTPVPLEMAPALPGTVQNFVEVGHTALGSIGWHGGLALAGDCAYVGNRQSGAVTIVDIADPANPLASGQIQVGGSAQPVEIRTIPERNLLVVADLTATHQVRTYDVSNCHQPQLLGTINLAAPIHEFYLWHDGTRILMYVATFGEPLDLIVVDLTDPAAPQEITRWSGGDAGLPGQLHSLTVSPDGARAYLAMWGGGFAVADLALPNVYALGVVTPGVPVLWFPNAHSAVPLQDTRYVLLTSEIYTCPFGGVLIVDAADPAAPSVLASLNLPENRCDNPLAPDAVFTAHNPLIVGDLAFITWYGGGLQALDVSDPAQPQRVGQYVPSGAGAAAQSYVGRHPVQMWSYPILRNGLLYIVDIQSGLHIVRYTGPKAELVAGQSHVEGNVTVLP